MLITGMKQMQEKVNRNIKPETTEYRLPALYLHPPPPTPPHTVLHSMTLHLIVQLE